MARLGRIVAAGFPHHVTQRGNRRQTIFFEPADYALYRDLLAERCRKASVEVWAYCLMPNHVHLVLRPSTPDGLARAIGETHRQYTGFINARARWTGHLFQGRFSSVALDEALVPVAPILDRVGRFAEFIEAGTDRTVFAALRTAESTGRPLGSEDFVARLERLAGRRLRKAKPGRKPSARLEQLELEIEGNT